MFQHKILTIEEVAKLVRVSDRTIYEWAQKGKIPCGKLGNTWRFKRDEIEKWIDERIGNQNNAQPQTSTGSGSLITPDQILFMNHSIKIDVLNELALCLTNSLRLSDQYSLATAILEREELMSTGIGMGIAVPHVRLPSVNEMKMAIGINSKDIIDYESLDGEGVRLIFMIVAGKDDHTEYLRLLSKISSNLKNEDFRNTLLNTSDKSEAYNLIKEIQE